MSSQEVKEGLAEKGIQALEVHRMHRPSRPNAPGIQYEMVLAILATADDVKRIYEIRDISGLSGFKIETPHNKGEVGQCHNCQKYGHSSRNCRLPARCVKCLGEHGTVDCPRPKDRTLCTEPPSCTNCRNSGHPANYRGCSHAPKKRPTRSPRSAAPQSTRPTHPPPQEEFRLAPAPVRNPWFPTKKATTPGGDTPAPPPSLD
ncbi:hypothetical protein O3G_MSEX015414 [Manduca sexta]|uniref:CCHC-type domain-containing protein n=1 Tax=Manduca sexta TaxID=7130 RepID=A0A921ZZB3_MANSE|nr:hypothetical protein O3G_MSEX015414 [Manduca sexta]